MKKLGTILLWVMFAVGVGFGLYVHDGGIPKIAHGSEGTKVTDKTALEAAPAMNDVFYIVDVSESGVTGSKKIEIEYLRLSGVSDYVSGTTATLDFSSIDMPTVKLSSGTTVTVVFSNLPTSGVGARIYYLTVINQNGSGTIGWPSGCVWASGTPVQPTSGTSNSVDIFPFLYGLQSGTTKYMLTPIKDMK